MKPGTMRWRLIASKMRGVEKEAATLMPNMLTTAPSTIRLRITGLAKALARITGSVELRMPVGLTIMAIPTTPT